MKIYKIENQSIKEIEINELTRSNEDYYWIIANSEELQSISPTFGIKTENIQECFSKRHETKIDVFPNYNFCTFNEIESVKEFLKIEELNVFYSRNFIICVTNSNSKTIGCIINQLNFKENNLLINATNPCNKILYLILDTLFLNYFESIIEFEKKVEHFEEGVLRSNLNSFLSQFIAIRRQVLRIIRYITPLVYLIDIIKLNENSVIDESMMRYFENLEIKYNKLDSNIVNLRESVAYLREAYEAEVSNQANKVMKIFTIVSAIFLPLTLLTGIFGMNFKNIPWLEHDYGFYVLMFFMGIITIALIGLFKKKRWI